LHETVYAGDADVVSGFDVVAHSFGSKLGLFGDRDIAGAGADDGDCARAADGFIAPEADDARKLVVFGLGMAVEHEASAGRIGARDEHIGSVFDEAAGDGGHLFGRFTLRQDNFGHAVAEGAMMIHFGEA
jgi:hypothetical protein